MASFGQGVLGKFLVQDITVTVSAPGTPFGHVPSFYCLQFTNMTLSVSLFNGAKTLLIASAPVLLKLNSICLCDVTMYNKSVDLL